MHSSIEAHNEFPILYLGTNEGILSELESICVTDLEFFLLWQLAFGTWCGGTDGVVLWCYICHGVKGSPFGGIDDSKVLDMCLCVC